MNIKKSKLLIFSLLFLVNSLYTEGNQSKFNESTNKISRLDQVKSGLWKTGKIIAVGGSAAAVAYLAIIVLDKTNNRNDILHPGQMQDIVALSALFAAADIAGGKNVKKTTVMLPFGFLLL